MNTVDVWELRERERERERERAEEHPPCPPGQYPDSVSSE